ncbi:chitinase 18-4 [Microdochium trichocladiopsis]|uniref:chitinase n=1 Tax=Microdochium trichocladiopsis TaxID=1682393 RepID=A0A9P8XXY2_9PEZI|nr:chitinase 18-4 [Microdochium trichocladiopsis]KAH7018493.1 chitinase 18-4 [Microdochium trichocladiopsis]
MFWKIKTCLAGALLLPAIGATELRNIMYLTNQHEIFPGDTQTAPVTHVAMSFMRPHVFNRPEGSHDWPAMWQTVEATRAQFRDGVKVLIAIGGWGDTEGFSDAARTAEGQKRWAANVAAMVKDTGADGVDIDWEYPGGNGEDYKTVPNEEKAWEIEAYPKFLGEIRTALGANKIISAAVPGKVGDMLAFTADTLPTIMQHVDFLNVMTYDMMNRRDNVTKHHTGVKLSIEALDAYIDRGARAKDLNLGFAFYVKWFKTQHEPCLANPIGCPTVLMEDPETGADLGQAGAFAWADQTPDWLSASWQAALTWGKYDPDDGSYYHWDENLDVWWTFDTARAVRNKFQSIVRSKGVGGVFAWELGSDGPQFSRWQALNKGVDFANRHHSQKHEL